MGTWGTSLYSCDIAEDVRDACHTVYSFYDIEEGHKRIFSAFHDVVNQEFVDNEYASFWYALSDWQWKHGMLNQNIKEKALLLLENYAGLDEWEGADFSKRKNILNQLREQLLQVQPDMKKPRAKVSKPKHTSGDIIVFQASKCDEQGTHINWKIESLVPPLFFESLKYRNSQYEDIEGYDARGQWMALLCIGTVKEKYSKYVDDIFNEHSLYVWYDYLSYERPSVDDLCKCGFLPYINWKWKDFNKNITECVEWGYEFTIVCEKFKKSPEIKEMLVLKGIAEVKRYKLLLSPKQYSSDYWGGFTLGDMFSTIFSEKNRAMIIGEVYDNLLNSDIQAPQLLSPNEIDNNFSSFIRGMS